MIKTAAIRRAIAAAALAAAAILNPPAEAQDHPDVRPRLERQAERRRAESERREREGERGRADRNRIEADRRRTDIRRSEAERSVWDLAPSRRGFEIEASLGHNTPPGFPTIDRFERGFATSIKSIDLRARSYIEPRDLANRGRDYVDGVADFRGTSWGGLRIDEGAIRGRGLDLAIPPDSATEGQARALRDVVEYGRRRGVRVRVLAVP